VGALVRPVTFGQQMFEKISNQRANTLIGIADLVMERYEAREGLSKGTNVMARRAAGLTMILSSWETGGRALVIQKGGFTPTYEEVQGLAYKLAEKAEDQVLQDLNPRMCA
jgi:hypothetical protein